MPCIFIPLETAAFQYLILSNFKKSTQLIYFWVKPILDAESYLSSLIHPDSLIFGFNLFFFSHLTIKKNFVSLLDSFQENDTQKYKISPVSFDYETR